MSSRKHSVANGIFISAILLSALLAPISAKAADCAVATSTYIGNGTIGVSGTSYITKEFTQTGACTWVVPSGVTNADVLVVGGGGGGGGGFSSDSASWAGAGGGGGSYLAPAFPLAPGTSMSVTVGGGGNGGTASVNRDTAVGAQGVTTSFGSVAGSVSGGGGGGGGYSTVASSILGLNGTAGGGGGGTSNFWYAYGTGTAGSPVPANGGTGQNVTIGAKTFTGVNGGKGGTYIYGTTTGAAGSGGGRSNASTTSTYLSGSGLSETISGGSVEYGRGGLASPTAAWSLGIQPAGYGFGGTGGFSTTSGSKGANGVVVLRYVGITSSAFALTGNATTAIYRTAINISAAVTGTSKVLFTANGRRIPNCIKVSTTGTAPNLVATCIWKPAARGYVTIAAVATPTSGTAVSLGPITVFIGNRSNQR